VKQLLVDYPFGEQRLIEVHESGGVPADYVVHWDTSKDGPFPSAELPHVGYLVRSGDTLIQDAAKKTAHEANEAAKAAAVAAKAARLTAIRGAAGLNSIAQLRAAFIALATDLGYSID